MSKPEALRLAESAHLGYRIGWQRQAAAELRRLSAVEAQRDALLEALKELMVAADRVSAEPVTWLGKARAAIAKAEGTTE